MLRKVQGLIGWLEIWGKFEGVVVVQPDYRMVKEDSKMDLLVCFYQRNSDAYSNLNYMCSNMGYSQGCSKNRKIEKPNRTDLKSTELN